jgi:hypothetical protein
MEVAEEMAGAEGVAAVVRVVEEMARESMVGPLAPEKVAGVEGERVEGERA